MHPLLLVILIPAATAILAFLVGRLRNEFSFIGAVAALYYAVRLFLQSRQGVIEYDLLGVAGVSVGLRVDALSGFTLLFATFFALLVLIFSFRYMKGREGLRGYYAYLMLALACANGVLLASNLVVLLFFWGALLVVLYGLLLVGTPGCERVATKALVVVGLSDFLMLLGIVVLLTYNRWIELAPAAPLPLADPKLVLAFLLIAAGALAKAGSMPFHTWIPSAAETAPATVMAYIPSALDKLLGIYLLTRISLYMFNIASSVFLRHVLMSVGAVTILGAVMMALMQKRVTKLLAFHAVSQVGYMVLGIGTGIPVGIAGGLFHMVNNTLYKTGLFLATGSVEHWSKTDEIDKLGGLAWQMPVTFFSFLVCALAISGIPPLNGFASKWMVYQGIIELSRQGNGLFPFYLIAAMLGSVLTMASFLKLLHSMFFGQRPAALAKVREVGFGMWLPPLLLALACIVFGVFAYQVPLRGLIYPSLPLLVEGYIPGTWQPVPATLLMLGAVVIGILVYLLGTTRHTTPGRTFVGGERIADEEESRVTGTAFYSAVKHLPILDELLIYGERGAFDIYNWLTALMRTIGLVFKQFVDNGLDMLYRAFAQLARVCGKGLSYLANGSLPLYVAWLFIGAAVFYLTFFLR